MKRVLSGSILELAEDTFTISSNSPISLSHVNILHYFDNSKEMPVREHTDAYLFTLIPLNTCVYAAVCILSIRSML